MLTGFLGYTRFPAQQPTERVSTLWPTQDPATVGDQYPKDNGMIHIVLE